MEGNSLSKTCQLVLCAPHSHAFMRMAAGAGPLAHSVSGELSCDRARLAVLPHRCCHDCNVSLPAVLPPGPLHKRACVHA